MMQHSQVLGIRMWIYLQGNGAKFTPHILKSGQPCGQLWSVGVVNTEEWSGRCYVAGLEDERRGPQMKVASRS